MTVSNVFNIGVNGLIAQSNKITALSDNIANVNTVGYKGYTTDFLSLVEASNSILVTHNGTRASIRQINSEQGRISLSGSTTDLAINGNGFFVVTPDSSDTSLIRYTRAGGFFTDTDGNLRNSAGNYLLGWALDTTGALPANLQGTYDSASAISSLELVNLNDTTTVATANVNVKANVDARTSLYNPSGNITFASQPAPGDTITINGVTWTFVASGATGNQTNIGSDLDATITQLAADLNASANTSLTPADYSVSISTNLGIDHPGGQLLFTTNPLDGDTVTINGVTWTFVNSGATGNETNIGVDLATTLAHLVADLNNSGNALVIPSTLATENFSILEVEFNALNGPATTFTLASSSTNGAVTPLLLYDPATSANNMSSGAIEPDFTHIIEVVDNNGEIHSISVSYLKTAINTWAVEIHATSATDVISTDGQLASGTVTFNGDGTLASISSALTSAITFPWTVSGTTPTGATSPTVDNIITFTWGTAGAVGVGKGDGLTQVSTVNGVKSITVDGHGAGTLAGIEVSEEGFIVGRYSNGSKFNLYAIPLALFNNADGLTSLAGTAYTDSEDSGFINLFVSSVGGAGDVIASALEGSTVDIAEQITDIIIAQRAYQANTKTLTTTDDMLETLSQMLR